MRSRLAALLIIVAAFVAACGSTPAAPALTDPTEIITESAGSLAEVKTFAIDGTFSGSVSAEGLGDFDLSSMTLKVATDVEAKKASVTFDAPTLLGTKLDLIATEAAAYLKVAGPLGSFIGADTSGKWTKMPVEDAADGAVDTATDPAKMAEEVRKAIDELGVTPTKLADEKCGDVDCYHVQLAVTGADIEKLGQDAEGLESLTIDLWSRKTDNRPAKLTLAASAADMGDIGATFTMTYDGAVDITEPSPDEVVEGDLNLGG